MHFLCVSSLAGSQLMYIKVVSLIYMQDRLIHPNRKYTAGGINTPMSYAENNHC